MKLFFERLAKSSVLWKQVALEVITAVVGVLALLNVLNQAQVEQIILIASGVLGAVVIIGTSIYKLYSGGNNPANKEGY